MFDAVIHVDGVSKTYVSEPWPSTGVLFIPQMVYEYGEPRYNDTER
jgi:hypothetical protein